MKLYVCIALIVHGVLGFSQDITEYKLNSEISYKKGDYINSYGPFYVSKGYFLSVYSNKKFKTPYKSATYVNKGKEWKSGKGDYVLLKDYRNNSFGPIKDFIVIDGDTVARVKNGIGNLFLNIRKGFEVGEFYKQEQKEVINYLEHGKDGLVDEFVNSIKDSLSFNDKLSLIWYKFGEEKYTKIIKEDIKLKKEILRFDNLRLNKGDSLSYFTYEYKVGGRNYSREKKGLNIFQKEETYSVNNNGSIRVMSPDGGVFKKASFQFNVLKDYYINVKEAKVVELLEAINKSEGEERVVRVVVGFKGNYAKLNRNQDSDYPPQFKIVCDIKHLSLWLGKDVPVFIGDGYF